MRANRLLRRLTGRIQKDPAQADHRLTSPAPTPTPSATPAPSPAPAAARDAAAQLAPLAGLDGRSTGLRGPAGHTAARMSARLRAGLDEALARPDRGDISITTVIIWVAAVTGALLIAGTIAVVIAKYNGQLNGL